MKAKMLEHRILIVDDHVIIRRGLKNLIASKMPDVEVREVAGLLAMERELDNPPLPSVLVLDLQLGDGNGMDQIDGLRKEYPTVRILVYSMNQERLYGRRVLGMGCSGYLSKDASEDEVVTALRTVLQGKRYIGQETEMLIMEQARSGTKGDPDNPFSRLSAREMLVLDQLLSGSGVKEISTNLELGVSTVATYKARLFEKLGIDNILDLQTLARVHGHYVN